MQALQLKVEFGNSLRRLTVAREESFESLRGKLHALLGVEDLEIKYRDEEGDLITIATDAELLELLTGAARSGQTLRLIVNSREGAATELPAAPQQPATKEEPRIPFESIARAFADPETVQRIQAVFRSETITEVVNTIAQTYLDSKGDHMLAGLTAINQLGRLQEVWEKAAEDVPVLREVQVAFCQAATDFTPPHAAMFFHGARPFQTRCCPASAQHPVHFGVYCDGCESSEELRRASTEQGHRHPRCGYIMGARFKSDSADDFDLCEPCKRSGRFDQDFGPFSVIGQSPRRGCCAFAGERSCRGQQPQQQKAEPTSAATVPVQHSSVKAKEENAGVKRKHDESLSDEKPRTTSPVETEWVPVTQPDLFSKWLPQLSELQAMGFANLESYLGFLEEENGDLEKVVNRIVRREAE